MCEDVVAGSPSRSPSHSSPPEEGTEITFLDEDPPHGLEESYSQPMIPSEKDDSSDTSGLPTRKSGNNRNTPDGENFNYPAQNVSYKTDDSLDDSLDIRKTLASINQRLGKLDKLEDMNSALKGEITRVQSQVGEVSNQVTTVKSDLRRCEGKWEASSEAMMGRIRKVEQNIQALETKYESNSSDIQDELAAVQSSISSNTSKVAKLESKMSEYKKNWDSLGSLENNIKKATNDSYQKLRDCIKSELKSELTTELKSELRKEVVEEVHTVQENSTKEIRYDRLKDKAFNKRHNLVVFGLPENSSPELDRKAVIDFFSERMNFKKLNIDVIYRLGTVGNRPRPLVARFPDLMERWAIWNKRNNIKFVEDQPVWLQEDLPKRLREDNRVLQRVAKIARSKPEKYSGIKVKDYKVSINGKRYGREDLHQLPEELSTERIYTPCSEEATVFFTKHSPFSNHFHSPFSLDGVKFSCIEQYLAVHKAHLADDKDLARQAMESADPADHKVVLNKLRSAVSTAWKEKAPDLILSAVRAKFRQNHALKKILIDSYPLQIGEASRDSFWGIGLSLENADVLDTSKWAKEGNLLGRTLVSVRDELRGSQTPSTI